jgi:putative transposase
LWEGRFRSCLTQSECYVLSCYRYIELNPIRAGIVNHPRDYRWSSYRVNADGKSESLILPQDEYLRLGNSDIERQLAYRELLRVHMDAERVVEIRKATNGNYALGNDRIKKEVEGMLKRRVTPGRSGRQSRMKEMVDG